MRGICVLLVVIHHATSLLIEAGHELPRWVLTFDDSVAPFRMPTLMVLSGLLLPHSLRRSAVRFFTGKLRRIGWPYLVWSVVTLAATSTLSIVALARIPFFSPTYLWYLWFLLAFYSAVFAIDRLSLPLFPLVCLSLVASAFVPDTHRLPRLAFLFAFFLFGWWLRERNPSGAVRRHDGLLILVGLLAATGMAVAGAEGLDVRYSARSSWGPIGLTTAIVLLSRRTIRRPLVWRAGVVGSGWLHFLGRNSIVFYVTHLSVMVVAIPWLPDSLDGTIGLAVIVVVPLAVASGLACALSFRPLAALFAWPTRKRPVRRLRTLSPEA